MPLRSVPDADEWTIFLVTLFASCYTKDGLSVVSIDIMFRRYHIKDDMLFTETVEVLSRAANYLEE